MNNLKNLLTTHLTYLEDLRRKLYRAVIIFALVFLAGFLSAGQILKKILSLVHLNQVTVATSSPFEFANVAMNVGFFLAIIVVTPYLIYSLYSFISPALTKPERDSLLNSVPLSIGLFIFGFLYGFLILYYALQILAQINIDLGIQNIWNIGEILSQMFLTAALLGLVFELPILLTILIKAKLIETNFLKQKRRLMYFLVFCLVSLLPPTDGLSLVAMSLPLLLLYEVTILSNNNKKYDRY